ncbi:MAG: hypothetical protein NZ902_06495, partial [Acidilobaceae archaeon]|nr:hypothetical protein [Acidilobaceae archaeon]
AGRRIYLDKVYASFSTSSASAPLTITSAGQTLKYYIFGSDGLSLERAFNEGATVTITLPSGGTGVVGTVFALYALF